MLQHIKRSCKKNSGRIDKSQSKLNFEVKREGQVGVGMGEGSCGNLVIAKYNASKIRVAISKMIYIYIYIYIYLCVCVCVCGMLSEHVTC